MKLFFHMMNILTMEQFVEKLNEKDMEWIDQNVRNGLCCVKNLNVKRNEDIEICFHPYNGKLTDGQIEYAARILEDYKKYRDTAFERLGNWIAEGEYRESRICFGKYAY